MIRALSAASSGGGVARRANTMCSIGSSTGANDLSPNQVPLTGILANVVLRTGLNLTPVGNFCASSTVIAAQTAQYASAMALDPEVMTFYVGSNDLYNGASADTIWAWLKPKIVECLSLGKYVIVLIPFVRPGGLSTSAFAVEWLKYRGYILDYAVTVGRERMYTLDMTSEVADHGSTSLAPLDTTKFDSIATHLVNNGAWLYSLAFDADLLWKFGTRRIGSPFRGYNLDTAGISRLRNLQFTGTAGIIDGAFSGVMPDNWIFGRSGGSSGTGVASIVTRANGRKAIRMTLGFTAPGEAATITGVPQGSFAAAQSWIFGGRATVVSGGANLMGIALSGRQGADSVPQEMGKISTDSVQRRVLDYMEDGTILHLDSPIARPGGATLLDFVLRVTGGAVGTAVVDFEAPYYEAADDADGDE